MFDMQGGPPVFEKREVRTLHTNTCTDSKHSAHPLQYGLNLTKK